MTRVMMRVGCGIMSRRLAGGDVNAQAGSSTYALLTDGTTIEIRATRPDDFDAVRNMHAKMSSENLYLRFFGLSRSAAEGEARRTCREPAPDHAALLAVLEGQVVGCGSYEVAGDGSRSAEGAMAGAGGMHPPGGGTPVARAPPATGRLRQLRGGWRRLPIGGGRHGGRRWHAPPWCRHAAARAPDLTGPRPGRPHLRRHDAE